MPCARNMLATTVGIEEVVKMSPKPLQNAELGPETQKRGEMSAGLGTFGDRFL
jgi:hypothetical protein